MEKKIFYCHSKTAIIFLIKDEPKSYFAILTHYLILQQDLF